MVYLCISEQVEKKTCRQDNRLTIEANDEFDSALRRPKHERNYTADLLPVLLPEFVRDPMTDSVSAINKSQRDSSEAQSSKGPG